MTSLDLTQLRDDALATELRGRGWICVRDDGLGWETPAAFSRRMGHHKNFLCHLIHRGTIPPGLELHRAKGGKGRLVMVRGNEATANWMECRKKVCA